MLKRTFDLVLSLAVTTVAAPFWLIVAAAIKLDSPGPVFHRSVRIGRDWKPFTLLKFRTMVANAAEIGPGVTREDDTRITPIGRALRRLKIDEMPQLINVLRGEMSIVGPRPEDPRYVERYQSEYGRILSVRPGMASPAFIRYRHEEAVLSRAGDDLESVYLEEILPDKLALDLEYVERRTFWLDLKVFLEAAASLFSPPRRGPPA